MPASASQGSEMSGPARFLATVAITVFGWVPIGCIAYAAVLMHGLQCDDHCISSGTGPWMDRPGVWQWSAQLWGLALPALVAVSLTVVFAARGRRWGAGFTGLIAAALSVAWLIWVAP